MFANVASLDASKYKNADGYPWPGGSVRGGRLQFDQWTGEAYSNYGSRLEVGWIIIDRPKSLGRFFIARSFANHQSPGRFRCGLDLLRNTHFIPDSRPNPNGRNEIVHRFAGKTKSGEIFYVQVREDRRGNKYLMSIFPDDK